MSQTADDPLSVRLKELEENRISPLDLVPRRNLVEKLIELVLVGPPAAPDRLASSFEEMAAALRGVDTSHLRVAVFGGGSGLSNVIGGDSRNPAWPADPFQGIKELFPNTSAIVCVTDDGGSTGELMKDLPIIALGDIRHVLLSSIREKNLSETYRLSSEECRQTAAILHSLFNVRFSSRPSSVNDLLGGCLSLSGLPLRMAGELFSLLDALFGDPRLLPLLNRPHCLGNLLLVAAVYRTVGQGKNVSPSDLLAGINRLAKLIGAREGGVLPCTTTPAHLRVLYSNGVVASGESKTATARRNTAVDRVFVEFADEPAVPREVFDAVSSADIIVFAPGSLYTSIIPIMQVPGLAQAVRENQHALKILIANLWIQKGETDLVLEDPHRRFYVSDLINAYQRNIPGGVSDLFDHLLVMGMQDIPGSILQSYAVEDKVPIYLDRGKVWRMGFAPVEARIFSESALKIRKVQHDPVALAKAIKIIMAVRDHIPREAMTKLPPAYQVTHSVRGDRLTLDRRRNLFGGYLQKWDLDSGIKNQLEDIFWRHTDIGLDHLQNVAGLLPVKREQWLRSMRWDSVFSYYDPVDCLIKIREDALRDPVAFECAFLVALGQSLLGDYAARKEMLPVEQGGAVVGKIYRLTLEPEESRRCFFSTDELARFLRMVRMNQAENNNLLYTRLISGSEGFTPPGMLMGLIYAWYLDSRYASNIEYKMAIARIPMTGLVREQVRMLNRRMDTIEFFRKVVFGHTSPVFEEQLPLTD
ncbi:MAG: YvcK family protein [Deltaproteobacteria bacterium]|nr:YvcK family protein [Deltaproteobacteria bacterium]